MAMLGKSVLAGLVGAGTALLLAGAAALIAGTMGLLDPTTVHAAQPAPGISSTATPKIVPWLLVTTADPTGSGRTYTYLRIVHTPAKPPVRDNSTVRVQIGIAPPDLTGGYSGGPAGSAHTTPAR